MAFMMIVLAAISAESYAAMSLSDIRRESRFLTDRMGHELGLSNRQYNDVYEINFDFLYQVNEVIDDVVYGYDDAIDYYYYLLDMRNEDLMYVLRSSQYRRFVNRDYFYRPIYMVGHTWGMRIWSRYTDRNYYYFSIPTCYYTYIGPTTVSTSLTATMPTGIITSSIMVHSACGVEAISTTITMVG